MPPTLYPTSSLAGLLRRETVASMPRIMAALGTSTRRTVVRKLAALDHLTSYSHAGRFYALPESARFDEHGLWSFRGIRFSSHGTLRATAEALVRSAPAGLFVPELDALLQVGSGDALRYLASQQRLAREKFDGRFLYCTPATDRRRRQILARRAAAAPVADLPAPPAISSRPDLRDARSLFLDLLDERQRRLFAGLASLERGHGGDRRAAALTGLNPSTVARGRRELLSGNVPRHRVRRPGGGRHRVEKKTVP